MNSDEDNIEDSVPTGKKRKANKSLWKRNKIKMAKLKGQEHTDYKGRLVETKQTGPPCSCKRKKCLDSISDEDQEDILTNFYDLQTKDEQDLFLTSLIDAQDVKQRRPRKDEPRVNVKSFKYHVMVGSSRTEVCFKAFLSLHAVTKKRVERLRALKVSGINPVDKRGRHIKKTLSEDTKQRIRQHIESFPQHVSHYLSKPVHYLDANLNIKEIYRMFNEKYPNDKVSYTYFFNFFNENFNLSFGRPQIDTCCVCEELNLKLKSPHLNEAAKRCAQAELDVHKRRAKSFYKRIKKDSEDKENNHILSICFDFMQNLQLPQIPVQETFYLRQLTVNLFCVHDIKNNKAELFVYHEGVARKGPNDVCSFLLQYLSNVPDQYTELHLYSDNCWGQNKNHALSRLLTALTELKKFKKIEQYYPMRGHSYLPCDRDFSIIKREIKKHDRIYTVDQIVELVLKSSKNNKFTVVAVKTEDVLDFKNWWPDYDKKNCISEETKGKNIPKENKVRYTISTMAHTTYNSEFPGTVIARPTINSIVCHTFKFASSGRPPLQLPVNKAYPEGKAAIKQTKLDDIRKLHQYVPAEHHEFYNELYLWPTTAEDIEDQ